MDRLVEDLSDNEVEPDSANVVLQLSVILEYATPEEVAEIHQAVKLMSHKSFDRDQIQWVNAKFWRLFHPSAFWVVYEIFPDLVVHFSRKGVEMQPLAENGCFHRGSRLWKALLVLEYQANLHSAGWVSPIRMDSSQGNLAKVRSKAPEILRRLYFKFSCQSLLPCLVKKRVPLLLWTMNRLAVVSWITIDCTTLRMEHRASGKTGLLYCKSHSSIVGVEFYGSHGPGNSWSQDFTSGNVEFVGFAVQFIYKFFEKSDIVVVKPRSSTLAPLCLRSFNQI